MVEMCLREEETEAEKFWLHKGWLMIKKENRLRKNKHFKYIYKHGETKSFGCVALTFAKTKFVPFKVGFSVSKKIGKSVVRSKVKRRMREAFCALQKNVNTKYNYIFVAKEGIQNLDFWQIKKNMEDVLAKNNLIVQSATVNIGDNND